MNDEDRKSEEVDIQPYEGKPDFDQPQAAENGDQDDEETPNYDEGVAVGTSPVESPVVETDKGQPLGDVVAPDPTEDDA